VQNEVLKSITLGCCSTNESFDVIREWGKEERGKKLGF